MPLDSAQAQELLDANQAMIDGGGYTASEVSFRLACMRVLRTLPRAVQREELEGAGRVRRDEEPVRAGRDAAVRRRRTVTTTRAEGAGPVDALTRAMRQELERWYPAIAKMQLGRFSVTAIDVSSHDTAAHVRVTVSFHADGPRAVDDGGREQRFEPGGADGDCGWISLLAAGERGAGLAG